MTESQNIAAVQRFVDAFNRRDVDALVATAHPDLRLHEWPEAPGSQSYEGPEGIRQAIGTWFESWEWMRIEVEDMREAGDKVLVTLHQRAAGRGSAVEVELRTYNVYSLKDGLVSEIHLFTDREDALEVFGR